MSQRKEEVALAGAWQDEADTTLMFAICRISAHALVVVLVVPNPTTVTS
jgi:hypothetical protein